MKAKVRDKSERASVCDCEFQFGLEKRKLERAKKAIENKEIKKEREINAQKKRDR